MAVKAKLPLPRFCTSNVAVCDAGEMRVARNCNDCGLSARMPSGETVNVMFTVCELLPSLAVTTTTRASVRLPREIRNGCLRGQISSFAPIDRKLVGKEGNEGDEGRKSKAND